MTEARSFDIDLVAFVRDASAEPPWSTELAEQTRDLVTWEHVTRDAQPHLFEAPRFAPDPDGTIWAPMSEQRARALGDRIATASSAWRIKSSARADDSSPLHAAMGLSAAALVERDGIALVDARTQVGFDADDWCERVAVLTEEGAVTLCHFVRVEHVPDGDGTLSVRTRGCRSSARETSRSRISMKSIKILGPGSSWRPSAATPRSGARCSLVRTSDTRGPTPRRSSSSRRPRTGCSA